MLRRLFVFALLPGSAAAQHRLTPAEVVRAIQESGTTTPVIQDLLFEGCPQQDPAGRSVFEAVSAADLPPTALAELSSRWGEPLATCGYAPLDAWFAVALRTLSGSGDDSAVMMFVDRLPADLPGWIREELWRARTSRDPNGFLGAFIASKAVRSTDASQRVDLLIAAFRDRSVSREWIYREAGLLIGEQPEAYLRALAQRSSDLSDDRLEDVLASVLANIRSGRLSAGSAGLEGLRQSVRERDALQAELRALGS